MKMNNFLLILFTLLLSSCSPKNKLENNSLEIISQKCYLVDENKVELELKLANNLKFDTLAIIADPWIQEGWDSDGFIFSAFIHTSCMYPFIQLLPTPTGGQGDIYRIYSFSEFKKFVVIPPKSQIMCKIQFILDENYIKTVNYELPILIEIPFTDKRTLSYYSAKDQVASKQEELVISLVDPEYYRYSTNDNSKITLDDVFKLRAGFSGNISISKK